ncbi:methyltransferase, partial [Perkinsus sp. BL_2016]
DLCSENTEPPPCTSASAARRKATSTPARRVPKGGFINTVSKRPSHRASAARAALARWEGRFDTVLMNPPFGTRRAGVDVAFLRAALALVHGGGSVFSLHKS